MSGWCCSPMAAISPMAYAASGTYINRMSNYCSGCTRKVMKKNGRGPPVNYLWFLIRNRDKLGGNARMG